MFTEGQKAVCDRCGGTEIMLAKMKAEIYADQGEIGQKKEISFGFCQNCGLVVYTEVDPGLLASPLFSL